MGANVLAGWQEAYHQAFVYGNISNNSTAEYTLHFAEDSASGMFDRSGFLYFTTIRGGFKGRSTAGKSRRFCLTIQQEEETPITSTVSNSFRRPTTSCGRQPTGFPYWNWLATFIGTFNTNLLNTNWGNITTPINGGSINGQTGAGWSSATNTYSFLKAVPLDPHMTGISAGNFLATSTQPFDSTTYEPPSGSAAINAGTAMAGAMAQMPVRFEYHPDTSTYSAKFSADDWGARSGSKHSK